MKFLPAGIFQLPAREGIERAALNSVDEFSRLAFRWNEIKPPPRNHPFSREPQNMRGDRVAVMMIVKEPAVDFAGAQRCLYRFYVRHDGLGGI
jgi:hypothetical protein